MAESLKGHYAGFISRLLAYGIDVAIVTVSIMALTWLVRTTVSMFQIGVLLDSQLAIFAITGVTLLIYVAAYYILFWTLIGQTPGKMIMGLRVVDLDGGPLSLWRSTRRFVGYLISLFALFAGFIWILIDDRRQGWHDKIAGTLVIYIWEAQPGKHYLAREKKQQEERQQQE